MSELNIKYNPADFTVIKKPKDKDKKGSEPPARTR